MTTLYDQNPQAWDRIGADGFPNLARMARLVGDKHEMADALSITPRSIEHWITGQNNITDMRERQAKKWLELAKADQVEHAPAAEVREEGVVLMVACSRQAADRVQKVLAMFGCEVVEV
jgi:DNA-binding transcriptional regulator YdaS (Cro superfamily)